MKKKEIWFLVGSQSLYGDATLQQVEKDSLEIATFLDDNMDYKFVFKKLIKCDTDAVEIFLESNSNEDCIGIVMWAHTFSPAKMWIKALKIAQKPLLHLHTQFNQRIPFTSIDMDYMNLHQSAHGDRELGHIMSKMRINREIVVGHYQDQNVINQINAWTKSCQALAESNHLRIARFGDNMNNVAVTDGNKVSLEEKLGWTILTFGIGDLVTYLDQVTESQIDELMQEYHLKYDFAENCAKGTDDYENVRYQAKLELGLEAFLVAGNFSAFTTNFDNLHGLDQLPGLAAQRLMEKGYGFAGEGDYRTAGLVRMLKSITGNKDVSFMEDYTYDFCEGKNTILQSHMLEICPTIAVDKPQIEVHPLGIGGKNDPARLVFNGKKGDGIAISLVDMGDRFRMICNEVETIEGMPDMPKLPVASTFWLPKPSLEVSAQCWIYAGGAHHTAYTTAVEANVIRMFCDIIGIEFTNIGEDTKTEEFKLTLKLNDLYYRAVR